MQKLTPLEQLEVYLIELKGFLYNTKYLVDELDLKNPLTKMAVRYKINEMIKATKDLINEID